jgi:hypothetical protein
MAASVQEDGAEAAAGTGVDAVKGSVSDTAAAGVASKAGAVPRKHSAGAVMQRVLSLGKSKPPLRLTQQQEMLIAASPAGIAAASPAGVADTAVKKDV